MSKQQGGAGYICTYTHLNFGLASPPVQMGENMKDNRNMCKKVKM